MYKSDVLFNPRADISGSTFIREQYVEDARATKRAYDGDVCGLMNQYSVEIECEVVNGYISKLINN